MKGCFTVLVKDKLGETPSQNEREKKRGGEGGEREGRKERKGSNFTTGVILYSCNPATGEAETGGFQVAGQPWKPSNFLTS